MGWTILKSIRSTDLCGIGNNGIYKSIIAGVPLYLRVKRKYVVSANARTDSEKYFWSPNHRFIKNHKSAVRLFLEIPTDPVFNAFFSTQKSVRWLFRRSMQNKKRKSNFVKPYAIDFKNIVWFFYKWWAGVRWGRGESEIPLLYMSRALCILSSGVPISILSLYYL